MSNNVDFDKIKAVIVDKLGCSPDDVTEKISFEELGADSLDAVEMIMGFEEEFQIEIPDADAEKMKTVADIIKYIDESTAQ